METNLLEGVPVVGTGNICCHLSPPKNVALSFTTESKVSRAVLHYTRLTAQHTHCSARPARWEASSQARRMGTKSCSTTSKIFANLLAQNTSNGAPFDDWSGWRYSWNHVCRLLTYTTKLLSDISRNLEYMCNVTHTPWLLLPMGRKSQPPTRF